MALNTPAQSSAPSTSETAVPSVADSVPAKLPYGVEDVLKLSRAQVSEDVTVNYIRNSGTIYNLSPSDVVYLRNEGVSDRVLNTMLDQRKNVPAEQAAQAAATAQIQAAAQVAPMPDATAAAAVPAVPQYAPAYVQPTPTDVEPQPTYVPASTVYVIPYRGSGYGYANYSPYYYGSYYSFGAPSTVFSIGFSSGGGCGPYYRGGHSGHYGGGHYRYYGRH
jgi:hypothetical protein